MKWIWCWLFALGLIVGVESSADKRKPAQAKPAVKKSKAAGSSKKKTAKKKEIPGEGWKVDKIEIPTDYKPTDDDLAKTRFWNYVDGPEVKDDVVLKNGQVLKQVGYNLVFVDMIFQDKDKKQPPLYIFKSSACRGACGSGYFYVLHSPAKNDYFEFPLPKAGYVREEGAAEQDISKSLWTKSEAYYGKCGQYTDSIVIYRQERECAKCPLLHELRIGSLKAKSFQVEMQREQGRETPKVFKSIVSSLARDVKKKSCKKLRAL